MPLIGAMAQTCKRLEKAAPEHVVKLVLAISQTSGLTKAPNSFSIMCRRKCQLTPRSSLPQARRRSLACYGQRWSTS